MKVKQKYSFDRREQALQRVALRADHETIESIAALVDVNVGTLKNWMKSAKKQSASQGLNKPSSAYTPAQRLDALLETAKLSDVELSAWCREKGLFPHDLRAWRDALTAVRSDESVQLREVRQQRDKLQRELDRKNKALAETAALLVLQKKFQDMFSDAAQ
jgi:transposase-like protein